MKPYSPGEAPASQGTPKHFLHKICAILSRYFWANLRLLERCAELTGEQEATIPGAFGSIRETLEHIVTSEQSYFSRISTGQPRRRPEDAPPLTIIEEMVASARATGSGLIEWTPKVPAEDTVQIDWDGTPREVPKTIILTQVINHATEHRAQVMAILTMLGIESPDLQSWAYFDELEG